MNISEKLIEAALELREAVKHMTFAPPVTTVYNPLEYAWESHKLYLETYGSAHKKIVFLGMNPGPWGMAQTGVPFGEINAVKNWLGIETKINKPTNEHPKRPVEGFACKRSEVSGQRLWGLFNDRFGTAEMFFKEHFIANYCPLVFMEPSCRNRTPDKLKPAEQKELFSVCDIHLKKVAETLEPDWLIGVGRFAERMAHRALEGMDVRVGSILHPSPASPAANRDWAGTAAKQLQDLEVWKRKK